MADTSHLTPKEEEEVEERTAPRPTVVHAAVVKQGEDEFERPAGSLFWSSVAAGFAIMASLVAQAALHHKLGDVPWRDAVADLGYTLGFVLVVLGRMQLFTEQTVIAVLPVAAAPTGRNFGRLGRLWTIVFAANLIGAAAVAALSAFAHTQSPEMLASMVEISSRLLERSAGDTLLQAIPAGFLIASVAWIRTASEGSGIAVIVGLTWAIALGGFAHVIAGAVEAFLLVFTGHAGIGWALGGFILPALAGNIIGGTGLFALLAHAQVKGEM